MVFAVLLVSGFLPLTVAVERASSKKEIIKHIRVARILGANSSQILRDVLLAALRPALEGAIFIATAQCIRVLIASEYLARIDLGLGVQIKHSIQAADKPNLVIALLLFSILALTLSWMATATWHPSDE